MSTHIGTLVATKTVYPVHTLVPTVHHSLRIEAPPPPELSIVIDYSFKPTPSGPRTLSGDPNANFVLGDSVEAIIAPLPALLHFILALFCLLVTLHLLFTFSGTFVDLLSSFAEAATYVATETSFIDFYDNEEIQTREGPKSTTNRETQTSYAEFAAEAGTQTLDDRDFTIENLNRQISVLQSNQKAALAKFSDVIKTLSAQYQASQDQVNLYKPAYERE